MDNETKEKILREGVTTDFWGILKEVIDEKIKLMDEYFLKDLEVLDDYSAEECKIRMLLHQAKKKDLENMKELPLWIVESLSKPVKKEVDLDPYSTKDDFLPNE